MSLISDAAVEPREAQRPTSLAARTPTAAIPGNGISPWVRNGPYVTGPSKGAGRRRSGASRRSIPSSGRRKWSRAGHLKHPQAKRWHRDDSMTQLRRGWPGQARHDGCNGIVANKLIP